MVVEKTADRPAFKRYVEALLVPILQPVQPVIPNNLSIHTGEEVRRLIEGAGCKLLLLPASSRDITPIEPAFAKIKQALRRAEARIRDAVTPIEWALDAVSVADARLLRPLRLPSPRGQLKRATLKSITRSRRNPSRLIVATWAASRSTKTTWCPARCSSTPTVPPIAPAPTTVTRMSLLPESPSRTNRCRDAYPPVHLDLAARDHQRVTGFVGCQEVVVVRHLPVELPLEGGGDSLDRPDSNGGE